MGSPISFFKSLLSSPKIIDAGIKAADAVFYTPEEKERDSQANQELMLKFIEASMPMNVARRFIAIAVTVMWVVCGLTEGVMILLESEKIAEFHAFTTVYVMPPFTITIGFYFWKRMKIK